MKAQQNQYRTNFLLITAFMVLITVSLVIAVIISYKLTAKYVENEFYTKRVEVLDQTVKPYYNFFLIKIPEITSYQGFLDSASAANYSNTVFKSYAFVQNLIFYEIEIGNKATVKNNGRIFVKSVYRFKLQEGKVAGLKDMAATGDGDFRQIANKFSHFISVADSSRLSTQDEVFKTFYDVKPDKISYLNIPRREDIKNYRALFNKRQPGIYYKQNMMTFCSIRIT